MITLNEADKILKNLYLQAVADKLDLEVNLTNSNTFCVGDKVMCMPTGVKGVIVKQYYPTASEQQTMIKCADGRLYHAPTSTFRRL